MSSHNNNHNSTAMLITKNKNYGSLSDDGKDKEKDVYFDAVTHTDGDGNDTGNGDSDADTDVNNEQLQLLYTDELALKKEAEKVGLLPDAVMDWFYPPQLLPELQLFRRDNIAIPLCYLLVGFIQGLSDPILKVYPLDLGATEAQQTTIVILGSLPSSLKLLFGFLSDNFPLMGYRRKSYMIVGWLLTSLSCGVLLFTTDLSLSKVGDYGEEEEISSSPKNAPSIALLSSMTFLFSAGYWIADVMGDSILVEKSIHYESTEIKGMAQSSCYSYRYFGYMISEPVGMALYKMYDGPWMIVVLLSTLPLVIIPFVFFFNEKRNLQIPSTYRQCQEIWTTVCSRAVWQPMAFVYIYNFLQITNGAWNQYLRTVLHFTSTELNMISVASSVLLYVGVVAYKTYMLSWSWRSVYFISTILNLFFSALQLSLIANITFGVSPFFFALGDNALQTFIMGIQFLPLTIMQTNLCPAGSEGASFAMFTTAHNTAQDVSDAFSTYLLGVDAWDVSKEALKENDLSGMTSLMVFTTLFQFAGIFFVWMLPRNKEELFELHGDVSSSSASTSTSTSLVSTSSSSRIGGFIFLATVFFSVVYTTVVSILNIVAPGWNGES